MDQYHCPTNLPEALAALAAGPRIVMAGGTDVMPVGVDRPVLDITALPGLRGLHRHDDHWFLPCLTTWADIAAATALPPGLAGLAEAARQVGGRQIQTCATVVGNLCHASPAADGIPPLLALGAQVELHSLAGQRLMKLEDFILGPRQTARRVDELVLGLRIPQARAQARSVFLKLGARRYLVISIAMVAATAEIAADGTLRAPRIAVGACGPHAVLLPELAAALDGRHADPALVRPAHLAGLAPIDDVRAPAAYRRLAALELVRRAVAGLAA